MADLDIIKNMSLKKRHLTLGLIVFLALILRLHQIEAPLNDRHHFRQSDTYAIVLNLINSGGDILRPQFFQTPIPENVNGYYFGEFPIYQGFIFLLFKLFGENLVLARLVNIVLSLGGVAAIYLIGKKLFCEKAGLLAAFTFAVLPSSIFWGRAITPDWLAMISFMAATALIMYKNNLWSLALSSLALAITFLIKPFYLAFLPFHIFYLVDNKQQKLAQALKTIAAIYLLPILALAAWRWWAGSFPDYTKDPDYLRLLHYNQGWWKFWQTSHWPTLFWQKYFFGELLTTLGGIFSIAGLSYLLITTNKQVRNLFSWAAGAAAITFIISWGSQVHDYYLLPWLPVASILIGLSASEFINFLKKEFFSQKWNLEKILFGTIAGSVGLFLVYFLSFRQIVTYTQGFFEPQGYELYNDQYQPELQAVKQLIPQDALVLSLLKDYSPLIHNSLRRHGSVYVVEPNQDCPTPSEMDTVINHRINLGTEYLVIDIKPTAQPAVCPREVINQRLADKYPVIFKGEVMVAYQLEAPKLWVKQQNGELLLETFAIGSEAQLEVGGLPDTEGTKLMTVNWQKIGEKRYRVVISNTQEWESFKLYYLSPQVQILHPGWEVENDFLVRR